ncbi:hypothetical protein JCM10207_005477 [Rhodosporidiobolus poonsookiae]
MPHDALPRCDASFASTASTVQPDFTLDNDLEKQLESASSSPPDERKAEQLPEPATPAVPPAKLDASKDPRQWATWKKLLSNAALCAWVLSLTYASTAYVASIPALMRRYSVSQEVAILGLTLYVLGFAAGPLVFGPSSELYGRRIVYIGAGVGYIAFSWGAAFANNTAAMMLFRFFIGFFGAASINNVPASIGDFTTPANRGPYSIFYAIAAFGGPSLGPLCSSFIEVDAGWQWNFRVMALYSTITTLLVALVPETHGPTLLRWQQQREAKEGGGEVQAEKPDLGKVMTVYGQALKRPMLFLFTEPIVGFIALYLSVLYGVLYGFFEAFEVVYVEIRHFKISSFGLTYISLGLGFFFGAVLVATVGNKAYLAALEKAKAQGETTSNLAEARLAVVLPAAILCPISLFIFAWTAPFTHVHWIAPCIAEFLFGATVLVIFTSFIPYLIECYLTHSASALAAGMSSRSLFGAIFPLFTLQLYHGATVQGATSLFAGIACVLAPLPFAFKRIGPRLRAKSRYAVA